MTHPIECDLDDDCTCPVREAEFTGGTDFRGRWRRTWTRATPTSRLQMRHHVQIAGVWVRVPWLAWAMFS